jgi:hypothetical protein
LVISLSRYFPLFLHYFKELNLFDFLNKIPTVFGGAKVTTFGIRCKFYF